MASSDESRPDAATAAGFDVISDRGAAQLAAAVGPAYATWGQRVVAAILDNATLAGVTWLALGAGFAQPSLTPVFGTSAEQGWSGGPLILIPIGALAILVVLQATTGWTPGKLVVGIRVIREDSPGPAGLWTTLVRWALHLLDALFLVGYLRPLWHAKRQTFADSIAHTVVLQQLPDLPRRQGIAVYSAALVVCVLGLGYCLPLNSYRSVAPEGAVACELTGPGPFLTTGDITLDGSVSLEQERRMWTVHETLTAYPGATITWTSDPSVRDVDYRIELDARPSSADGEPVVSRSWDIGTGGAGDPSEDTSYTHTRNVSPHGDVHVTEVEVPDSDSDSDSDGDRGDLGDLGTDVWMDARLIADDEVVAECGSALDYAAVDGMR
ncbi:RDD family protein [Promicromonospora soli]